MSDSRPASGTGGFGPPTTYYGAIGLSLVGLVLGILWAMNAADGPMAFHGVVFTLFSVACLWGVFDRLRRGGPRPDFATDDGYNFAVVRAGAIASTFWGVIGFVVGLVIALQLAAPALNFDWPIRISVD